MTARDAPSAKLLAGFAAIIVIAGIWSTRNNVCCIDVCDLRDNLRPFAAVLYAFFIAGGSWCIVQDTGPAPEPDFAATAIFTFAVLIIAYAARKLGWR